MHRHINTDDRAVIASMLRAGCVQKDIAKILGFTKSTISHEIQRNKNADGVI
jgi:IS30 family transposase